MHSSWICLWLIMNAGASMFNFLSRLGFVKGPQDGPTDVTFHGIKCAIGIAIIFAIFGRLNAPNWDGMHSMSLNVEWRDARMNRNNVRSHQSQREQVHTNLDKAHLIPSWSAFDDHDHMHIVTNTALDDEILSPPKLWKDDQSARKFVGGIIIALLLLYAVMLLSVSFCAPSANHAFVRMHTLRQWQSRKYMFFVAVWFACPRVLKQ